MVPMFPHKITIVKNFFIAGATVGLCALFYFQLTSLAKKKTLVDQNLLTTKKLLDTTQKDLMTLKNQDQYLKNQQLEKDIKEIEVQYKEAVTTYEDLLKLKDKSTKKTTPLDQLFAQILTLLSQRNYASASAKNKQLSLDIQKLQDELTASFSIPSNVTSINTAPSSGYRRQSVDSDVGTFMVDIISADLNSTKVVVDTASNGDCSDNCPVDSLGNYAARSGAYAGVNGPYFCPASYPSCAGKTNSFDTLLMNKNKVYFNSGNNVYSTVPAVIFSGGGARWVGQSLEWGRDTGVDSVIANQPLLVSNNSIVFGGDGDPKKGGKGPRSFIATTGNTVYIGIVYNATVAEGAHVLKTMGIQYALNLDSGGSTALWQSGRYLAGPGRDTPFGILLVRK